MSNSENLVPLNKRTKKEQREIQSKGGKASGETRRQKKTLKESMEILLSRPISDKRKLAKVVRHGFEGSDADNRALLTIALFEKASSGDVPALREIRSLIDEGGSDIGQINELIQNLLSGDDDYVQ